MKRIVLLFALLVCVVSQIFSQEEPQKKVAVYITGDDVDAVIKKVIGAKLVAAITTSSGYAAVERTADFLNALSKEQNYQSSGEVRDSQIAKLGQRFGVKYVVVADITSLFDEYFIQARMINVETGLVGSTADVTGKAESAGQIISLAQRLSDSLMKGLDSGSNSINSVSKTINGRQFVDLGLSVKWATCNVGASSPEQFGRYYAWGETSSKSYFDSGNSRTYKRSIGNIAGRSDYDVARAAWGGTWRLPTRVEMGELIDLCNWQWITMGGQEGYKVTGPNGNSIFLPAAGYYYKSEKRAEGGVGYYRTSTPVDNNVNKEAFDLWFNSTSRKIFPAYRYYGDSVRPVSD